MRAVWITRSFLDYRVPVYRELSSLCNSELILVYNAEVVPERVQAKARLALGANAIGLTGEKRIGPKVLTSQPANERVRIPWQPGILGELRRHNPDVFITDGFFQWTAPALFLHIRKRVPLVVCYERTSHTERNAQWYRRLYRRLAMRFVDAVCCNGRLCGEYTRQLGVAADRITYGHMSADTEGLALALQRTEREEVARNRHRFGISGVCLLYVGKLIVPKGLRHLLAAWANIDPKLSAKASLLLVGDGPDREFLENFRAARGLSNVHFAGAIDYDSLALYYASADAFVIPTLEDNWSLVVPEAMSCGLPILCSKYNGCWPELVHEGDNGWLFDPLQPADTVRCLEECLRNASNLPTMGDKSLLILNEHTPQRAARAVFEACQLAMAACHPRRSEAFTDDER